MVEHGVDLWFVMLVTRKSDRQDACPTDKVAEIFMVGQAAI